MSKKQKSAPPAEGTDSPAATRRQFIRGSAGGAALFAGGKWSTPVVQNIVLPAHAKTSPGTSITDPCMIEVGISNFLYQTTVSGNLFGAADEIGGVNGTVTLQYLNCFGTLLYDDTSPVTTASDGTYSVNFAQDTDPPVGGCPNSYIMDIVALVNFPTVGQVDCPAHVKDCPCF